MSGGETPDEAKEVFGMPGFAWRVGLSIFVVFGWLAFLLIWLFFYAGDFDVFQNIAIFLVSVLIGIGILSAAWVSWGIRYASKFGGQGNEWTRHRGAWALSSVAGLGWLVFLIVWLFFYAGDYNGYQNLAIVIVSLLILGAVTSSTWLFRWLKVMRHKA
jgi:hypothetical protein